MNFKETIKDLRKNSGSMSVIANDYIRGAVGSDHYYKHWIGLHFTDGVKALCDKFACYWMLDAVMSYQPGFRRNHPNLHGQTWLYYKEPGKEGGTLYCFDDDLKEIVAQEFSSDTFPHRAAIIYFANEIAYLPSEE